MLRDTTTDFPFDRAYYSLLLLLISLSIIVPISGQRTASRPERGFGGEGSFNTSGIDSISLQSRSVNLHIPLASLPPMAGGKLSYTLQATYNSKLWDISRREVHIPGPECGQKYSTQTVQPASGGAGWQIGSGYEIFFRFATDDYEYQPPISELCDGQDFHHMNLGRYFKAMLMTPDGSEHELRIEGAFPEYGNTDTSREYLLGYYRWPGGFPGQPQFSSPVRFYTVDETFITAVYNPISNPLRWTLYFKDGTRIEQSGEGQRTIDTNGNSVLSGLDASSGFGFVRDEQTQREIRLSASTYNSQTATKVEFQGIGGIWQTVWVVWGLTTVKGKLYTRTDWDQTSEQTCLNLERMSESQFSVIREIILPETEPGIARKYTFNYNSDTTVDTGTAAQSHCSQSVPAYNRSASVGWGAVSDVTTPTGAHIKYEYTNDGIHDFIGFDPVQNDQVNEIVRNGIGAKTVIHDETTDVTIYGGGNAIPSMSSGGSTIAPDGTRYEEIYFPVDPAFGCCDGGTDGMKGKLVKTISGGRILTEKHWTPLGGIVPVIGSRGAVAANAVVDAEYTTLLAEDGVTRLKMSAKTFAYDFNGELLKTVEYDWFDPSTVTFTNHTHPLYSHLRIPTGVPIGATILRVTDHAYYNQAPNAASENAYRKRNPSVILGKAQETKVGTGSVVKSTSRFSYDGLTYGTVPTRGNLTRVGVFNDLDGQWIETTTAYTPRGNVQSTTDAKGNVTQLTYDAINDISDLYPTKTVAAHGKPIARTSTAAYDFHTGLVTISTDVDNNVSVVTSYDNLGRVIKIRDAADTSVESWTRAEYSDSNRRIIVRSDVEDIGDGRAVAIRHYDQLGRVRLSRTLENTATEDPFIESHGVKVETRYGYNDPTPSDPSDPENTLGALTLISNPFRAAASAVATNEPVMGWTLSFAANTGRHSEMTTFAGASLPAPWGNNTTSTGVVKTDIHADRTLVTDQAGKQRISRTNGIGELKDVWEIIPPDLWTEAISFPNQTLTAGYRTSYGYDVLGNLTTVSQGAQTRTFTYSSVSRLRSAQNPENGTTSYHYDPNGNLIERTDARGVKTTYGYDALDRVISRSYDDTTPAVTYSYDAVDVPNSKGQLTKVVSSVSTYRYTSYDAAGRVKTAAQDIASSSYTLGYEYNLAGSVKEIRYPSLRKVNYSYDSSGRLSDAVGNLGDNIGRNYAIGILYDAGSRVTREKFGTDAPVYRKAHYNSRGQTCDVRASRVNDEWGGELGALVNDYSTSATHCGNGANNNGNLVMSQTIINSVYFEDRYTYDSLNRLTGVSEYKNGTTLAGRQQYDYDRWGNRTVNPTSTLGTNKQFTVTANNRLAVPKGGVGVMSYDAAGNLTVDTYSSNAFLRSYDAENRMISEKQTNNVTVGNYAYDGDGRRVIRTVNGATTWQIYGIGGELLAEYPRNGSTTNPTKEYGYREGQLLVVASAGNAGWGPPPVISDNPLLVGATFVRSKHITELRTAIDALRSKLGKPAFAWQQPAATGDLVKTAPIVEMRTAIDQTLGAPSGGYSPGLTQGSLVKAIHIQELRDRVLAAWNGGSSVQIDWLVADHLGTPRMIIDKTGKAENVRRNDYLPFGEELETGREMTPGYRAADDVRQKFTGYERDAETDLDFARARHYSRGQARFTSVDPLLASGRPGRPQSWNRYAYVLNQPLTLIDPTGMDSSGCTPQRPCEMTTEEEAMAATTRDPSKALIQESVTIVVDAATTVTTTDADPGAVSLNLTDLSKPVLMNQYTPTPYVGPETGPHSQDNTNFTQLNYGIPMNAFVSMDISLTTDDNGNVFLGAGIGVGVSYPQSFSLLRGTTYGGNGRPVYGEADVANILSGPSTTITGGAGLIFSGSWNNPDNGTFGPPLPLVPSPSGGGTVAAGIGTPQFGISYGKASKHWLSF